MRTEAMIEAINSTLRKEGVCSECAFDCKDGKFCMLIAIGARLRVLTKNVAKAQRLMREAVDDLKDADMLECSHCRYYRKMDVQNAKRLIATAASVRKSALADTARIINTGSGAGSILRKEKTNSG